MLQRPTAIRTPKCGACAAVELHVLVRAVLSLFMSRYQVVFWVASLWVQGGCGSRVKYSDETRRYSIVIKTATLSRLSSCLSGLLFDVGNATSLYPNSSGSR